MPTDLIVYYKTNEAESSYPFKFEEDTFWTTQKSWQNYLMLKVTQ